MIHIGNEAHGHQVMALIDSLFSPVTMKVISREEDGKLLGAAVYENWTGAGGSIEAHIGSFAPRWLNRDFLFIMFDYPFVQLDCKQAFVRVKAKNEKSLHWSRSLGFKEYVTIKDVFPDDDMVVMNLKREDCRFLNIKSKNVHSNKGQ